MRSRRSGRTDLPARLEALRLLVELGEGRLDPDAVAAARSLLDRAGERLRLSADHTVVALAGATGSGKSSFFNALTGLEIATVGIRRPTTSEALACVWGTEGAGPLLEWLGIPRRHQVSRASALDAAADADLNGLVLLDLPDHDSTAMAHRLEVDRLVQLVDALVWVVDPQKYADAALHEGYLRPLRSHADVMVVVLNKADTLAPQALAECQRDLRRLLDSEGLQRTPLLTASATTKQGLDDVHALLVDVVKRREVVTARIAADLDDVLERLEPSVGQAAAGSVSRREEQELVNALAAAAGVPAVVRAVASSHRARSAAATGWPFTRWLRRLRADPLTRLHLDATGSSRTSLPVAPPVARAQVDTAVRRVATSASDGLPQRWVESVRSAARPDTQDLADDLDRAVATTPVTEDRRPLWWTLLGLLQWLLAAAVVVGLGWLAVLFVLAWLQLPDPPAVEVYDIPLPTVLLVGGVLGGLLLAALGRIIARVGARRR
ncbi:MAG: 50S ribosome-binding GTPase, partial [Actinomycetota bacterium]|nr:50S ribosome-binding GTPase [Actinomycetota bacterium]